MKRQYVNCEDIHAFLESISHIVVDLVETDMCITYHTDCQNLRDLKEYFFKFMTSREKDYSNISLFYSGANNDIIINLSKKHLENSLQITIQEYYQKQNEIESLLTMEIIKHVQALCEKFPQIQSFTMAMGLVSFDLEYDMRIEDGEENDENSKPYMVTRDVSLYSFMGDFYDDEKYALELFGIDKDPNFIILKDIVDTYGESFKMGGEGLRMEKRSNFVPKYKW